MKPLKLLHIAAFILLFLFHMEVNAMSKSQEILDDIVRTLNTELKNNPTLLKDISSEKLVAIIQEKQIDFARQYQFELSKIREANLQKIEALVENLHQQKGGLIVLRHGEQDPGTEISTLTDAQKKKVLMMQEPHNTEDPITGASAIEFISTLLTIRYIQANNPNFNFIIETSNNLRAKQPAMALSKFLSLPEPQIEYKWTCINYPADAILPYEELIKYLIDGTIPWDREIIDKIAGNGTYDRIKNDIKRLIDQQLDENTVRIVITHTQQTQAFCEIAGLNKVRLTNYGLIKQPRAKTASLYEEGLYTKDTLAQSLKQAPTLLAQYDSSAKAVTQTHIPHQGEEEMLDKDRIVPKTISSAFT